MTDKKELLTEEEETGNMVLLDVWYEYKIIDTAYTKTQGNTEIELNDHAKEGWRVVGVTDHWIYLEKRRTRYLKG